MDKISGCTSVLTDMYDVNGKRIVDDQWKREGLTLDEKEEKYNDLWRTGFIMSRMIDDNSRAMVCKK